MPKTQNLIINKPTNIVVKQGPFNNKIKPVVLDMYQIKYIKGHYIFLKNLVDNMLAAKLIDFTLYNKLIEEGKALRTVTRHSGAVYEYLDNNTLVIISKTSLPQHLGKDNIYIGEFINPQTGKIEKVYLS